MSQVINTVYMQVEYFSGDEKGDIGTPYYVASSDELMFTTDSATFEELLANVRECLMLSLQDTDSIQEYGVALDAKVKIILEPHFYAA